MENECREVDASLSEGFTRDQAAGWLSGVVCTTVVGFLRMRHGRYSMAAAPEVRFLNTSSLSSHPML